MAPAGRKTLRAAVVRGKRQREREIAEISRGYPPSALREVRTNTLRQVKPAPSLSAHLLRPSRAKVATVFTSPHLSECNAAGGDPDTSLHLPGVCE